MFSPSSDDLFNLRRFADQQRNHYSGALAEIRAGRKTGHWIWYIFPTPPFIVGGTERGSPTNRAYAIRSDEEAMAYLSFEEGGVNLRSNLLEASSAVREQLRSGQSALALMGMADEPKLQSCMEFFSRIARQRQDAELLEVCHDVLQLMGSESNGLCCGFCTEM
eukprot:TRINITY_DN12680_c0_g1_i1.p1 TRINITY_DN12680_c0_g1~~TRINITY_DN12680_c0_g1_i1.p1  ORF type:complete len:164 (-),score=38.57 TRINITY_DN12680_c0_g1_i1:2-493(-)